MNANKTQAVVALIAILDVIYDDDSVREIRKNLINLNNGMTITQSEVDKIFGEWADYNPNPNPQDPHKAIKFICAYIKEQMFR